MAAVVIGSGGARPVTPVGYEYHDKCVLTDAVVAGQLLTYTGNMVNGLAEMGLAAADAEDVDGIALMNGYDGEAGFSVGIQGEMDGFSGLTPGADLYPSPSVAGGIDTTATTSGVVRLKAVTTTRIRFSFV